MRARSAPRGSRTRLRVRSRGSAGRASPSAAGRSSPRSRSRRSLPTRRGCGSRRRAPPAVLLMRFGDSPTGASWLHRPRRVHDERRSAQLRCLQRRDGRHHEPLQLQRRKLALRRRHPGQRRHASVRRRSSRSRRARSPRPRPTRATGSSAAPSTAAGRTAQAQPSPARSATPRCT